MKKLGKALLALTMALTFTACGSSEEKTEETVKLTIATSPDYAPYESLDTDGNIVGFDVDMVKLFEGYLKEETGKTYTLEFSQMSFDNIIGTIQAGQVDLGISGFTYDEERKVEWSEPYLGTDQMAVVPSGSKITSVDQLKDKKLAAQTGATGEKAAAEVSKDVDSVADVQNIFAGLSANQYDAAVVDSAVAKNYAASGNFTVLEQPLLVEKNYVIAKEGNKEVIELMNKCIKKFLASEDYKKLCEKYEVAPLAD